MYDKKIIIDITELSKTNQKHVNFITITGNVTVDDNKAEIFVSKTSKNEWLLKVFNDKHNIWQKSITFPKTFKDTSEKSAIAWITNNVKNIFIIAGKLNVL